MTRAGKILQPLALLLLLVSMYVHFVSANAADKNWLLLAARMWLSGKKLYVDIFETNPPLIIWLYAIPVWISERVSIFKDYNILTILGFIVVAIVLCLSTYLIAQHPAFIDEKKRQRMFALLLAYVFVFFTMPTYFFDREHILLVLTFPYILRFSPSLAHRTWPLGVKIAIGLLAGVGFCIKPHTVIIFALLQAVYMVRERSFAMVFGVETLLVIVSGGLYVASIYYFTPEYISVVMPMAYATYSSYSQRVNGIYSIVTFVVLMGITFADFRPRHSSPYRKEIYYFLWVCAGYLFYALANNGWAYTYNPLISIARLLIIWVLMEFIWLKHNAEAHGLPSKPFLFGQRACGFNLSANVLFYAICFFSFFLPFHCEDDNGCMKNKTLLEGAKQYHPHSFGTMSLEFYKWSELSRETGATMDVRFHHLWMLPKFILSDAEFARTHQWILDYVGRAYAQDLNERKPEIIYIDTSPEVLKQHPGVKLLSYLDKDPLFQEAWKHYKLLGVIDACHAFAPGEPASKAINTNCRLDVYGRIPNT